MKMSIECHWDNCPIASASYKTNGLIIFMGKNTYQQHKQMTTTKQQASHF